MSGVRAGAVLFALLSSCRCGSTPSPETTVDATAEASAPAASASAAASDAGRVNACLLLTQAEVEETTGLLAPPKRGGTATNASCSWGTFEKKILVLQVFPSSSHFDESRRSFETLYKSKAIDVVDLGKRAFYLEGVASIPAATLVVERPQGGAVLVQISGKDFSLPKAKDETAAIAKAVLAKP